MALPSSLHGDWWEVSGWDSTVSHRARCASFASSGWWVRAEQMNREGYQFVWPGVILAQPRGISIYRPRACFFLDTLVVGVCGYSYDACTFHAQQ